MMKMILRSVAGAAAFLLFCSSSSDCCVSAFTSSSTQTGRNTITRTTSGRTSSSFRINNDVIQNNVNVNVEERQFISSSSSLFMASGDGEILPLPKGSLVALATPMKSDGSVDGDTLRELLRWHKSEGTNGVVILGTTGEASTLSFDEKNEIMKIATEEIGGTIPIIVGTGTIDTKSTIDATLQAKAMGADAALVVTPYYVKPSQTGLIEHFTAVADQGQLPIVLYNVPGRTGVDLSVESTVKLAAHPMIHGIKDATGDNNRVEPMRSIIGSEFKLYSGEDGMARDFVAKGGDGVISVTANVAPNRVSQIMNLASSSNDDDTAKAKALDKPLQSLHRDLFCEANPIPVKWALYKMGKTQDGIRLPLTVLGQDFHERVEAALLQGMCIESDASSSVSASSATQGIISYGWPSRNVLLQGQLFDTGLINQVLELIEKRGGDFEIINFSVQPNDQFSNADFNFKRPSSVTMKVFGVDTSALDDILKRLQSLVDVIESAEGVLTIVPNDDDDDKSD